MAEAYEDVEYSTIREIFRDYARRAKDRGYDFQLSQEEFTAIIKQICHYCGAEPRYVKNKGRRSKRGAFVNGIDRVNNKEGYIHGNILPCCSSCNFLKGKLELKEFYAKIETIYKRKIKNEN